MLKFLNAALPLLAIAAPAWSATCEELRSLKLPNTTISAADSIPGGKFSPPYGDSLDGLPAFCRVTGLLQPTADSLIHFEAWLPTSGWNGKFLGVGNGGFAGAVGYQSMAGNLKRGYATAGTDTGHEAEAGDASWAFGHPEKVVDFGYRALHETTQAAKAIIQSFYTQPPKHSYFDACSDGGREALMEAQRFPEDYDGILAGAPANYWTHLLSGGLDVAQAMYTNPAAYISSVKLPAITAAVLGACDAQDGVKDGILNDPLHCRFDPAVLLCKDVDARTCLTRPQVTALKKLYVGGQDSHGEPIFPGFIPGAEESGWEQWLLGIGPGGSLSMTFMQNYFRYVVYQDSAWNPITAKVDDALHMADEKTGQALNAIDPDLSRFAARGGKLILYHGWNDPAISPLNTINYYNSLKKPESYARLYMIPGMEHCIGGPGPSAFGQLGTKTAKGPEHGMYDALEAWVEKGTAPAEIIATKYNGGNSSKEAQMTRPLCPYPQIAKYKGSGDINDSKSFSCAAQ